MNAYLMKFYDNNYDVVFNISDMNFYGRNLDFKELKNRFNNDFIKNKNILAVEIIISACNLTSKVVAGYRGSELVFIDSNTKQEFTIQQYRNALKDMEYFLKESDIMLT